VRFLADMGVPNSVVIELRRRGNDAIHLREEGLQRLPDDEIFQKTTAEDRILLTFDLDFSEIVALAPLTDQSSQNSACEKHKGVLMIEYETIKQRAAGFMVKRGWKRLTAKRREFQQSLFEHTMVELDALISLLPILRKPNHFDLTEEEGKVLSCKR
jgi:hypothetical protein